MSFTASSTGGEYKHTLSVSEIPSHIHSFTTWIVHDEGWKTVSEGVQWSNGPFSTPLRNSNNLLTNPSGNGQSHNNIQPYITVFFWRRTA